MKKPTKEDEKRLREALDSLDAIFCVTAQPSAELMERGGVEPLTPAQRRYLELCVAGRIRAFLEANEEAPKEKHGVLCLRCNDGARYSPRGLRAHVDKVHMNQRKETAK